MTRFYYFLAWVLTLATAALAGYGIARPERQRCVEAYELGADTPQLRLYVYSLGGCFRSKITEDPDMVGLDRTAGAYRMFWDD